MYNFIQDCLDGEATLFQIDDYIDYWHKNSTGMTLRQFLGMTPYEYQEWGKNSDTIIRDILRCRCDNIDFSKYCNMSEGDRKVARSYDVESVSKI